MGRWRSFRHLLIGAYRKDCAAQKAYTNTLSTIAYVTLQLPSGVLSCVPCSLRPNSG